MIGTRLGSWILDKEIGRGGMGCVYLAHREPAGAGGSEQAAIKVLAAELAVDPGFLARFEREIEILRQLDHPNIVRFLDSGQQDTHSYLVMEYVPGPSFETLLANQTRLPWMEVLDLAWQITPALKHAHDRGIIHRDLKPSNLLRSPPTPTLPHKGGGRKTPPTPTLATRGEGERHPPPSPTTGEGFPAPSPVVGEGGGGGASLVKLTDFGIASLFASPHLTVTGGIVGTAEYLSPEQAAGKPVTRRSDLYSLGVVLYTLLTGRTPFVGDPLDLLHKHRFGQFDRPARLVPEIPYELDEIVCQLLEKDPAKRPGDALVLFRRFDSLKRKLAYQAAQAGGEPAQTQEYSVTQSATRMGNNAEGPATLMSRLMRQELERERTGGPVRRFFNRPWVLATLLLLCVGAIAWAFWPMGSEKLYERGAALMQSNDPDDWETAWDKYLGPLLAKEPDTPHRTDIERFRLKLENAQATREANRTARRAGPMGEAQWFYQEGLRLRQQGEEEQARRVWRSLILAFKEVNAEGAWVRLAEKELDQLPEKSGERKWDSVREAIRRARELRQQGKDKEAAAIVRALQELYRDDKSARAILKGE